MLLAIDIGNTQTVIGIYRQSELIVMWRLPTESQATSDLIRATLRPLFAAQAIEPGAIHAAALASVVPHLTQCWRQAIEEAFGVQAVVCNAHTAGDLFEADYPNPSEIGADRIADAVAMRALYGAPSIVVDFGTATNIEVIDQRGRFIGGMIAPGLQTSAHTLFRNGAKLAAVELTVPPRVVGKNTTEALQAGIVLGEVCRVDGLIRRIFGELGYEATVVATGGLAPLIAEHSSVITEVNPQLTLEGLRLIADRSALA